MIRAIRLTSPDGYLTRNSTMINVRMDNQMVEKLDVMVDETGLSRSDMMRAALALLIELHAKGEIDVEITRPSVAIYPIASARPVRKRSEKKRVKHGT